MTLEEATAIERKIVELYNELNRAGWRLVDVGIERAERANPVLKVMTPSGAVPLIVK